ncbi:hypothetical protein ABBQ32_003461 [Trebouxia sp. C0010 RCD-2024]
MPERIWIMEELNILHTMNTPIIVFTAGVMEDPHSPRGIRDTYRCLFQNSECLKLIGTARNQASYSTTLAALPKHRQREWYAWVKGVMENQDQDVWTQLQTLEPVLDMFVTDQSVRVISQVHFALTHQAGSAACMHSPNPETWPSMLEMTSACAFSYVQCW